MNALSRAGWVRTLPFVVFMAVLALRGNWQPGWPALDLRWLYAVQVLVPAAMIWWWRREYGELFRSLAPSLAETAQAAVLGLVVFALWINLDAPILQIAPATASFVPLDAEGHLNWPLVAVRIAGAALLVPLMEELFWRSFLMRWLQQHPFEGLAPQRVGLRAVMLSTFVFTLAHTLWLAAVIAGLAYAWIYIRSGKLWTAVIAHAVTNLALGLWVVRTGQWQFW